MDMRRFVAAIPFAAVLAAPLVFSATGYSQSLPCAGQCGPPFQLRVTFHGVTNRQAASVIMRNCANSLVVRIGPVLRVHIPGDNSRVWLEATIYTKSMARRSENRELIGCLRRSPAVIGAGYPD